MFGFVLLLVSLFFSVLSISFGIVYRNHRSMVKVLALTVWMSVISSFFSFFYYVSLFLRHQFSFVNVSTHSCSAMSSIQLFACSWSGQSGSLFLWLLFTGWSALIACQRRNRKGWTISIVFMMHVILLLLLLQAKPFAMNLQPMLDGIGLNPVLSHPLMVLHPPFAFLAYSLLGLTLADSLAVLLTKQSENWVARIMPYLYGALFGLTVTIVLGSLWAYDIIGWGGYWAFDPVESGSLSLWFTTLALIHLYPLYQSTKKGWIWFHLVPIFSVFSMYFVSFLIRSGLLARFTAHTYAEGSLVSALYGITFLFLIIPCSLYLRFRKKVTTHPLTKRQKYQLAGIYLLLFLGGILFLQVIIPVFPFLRSVQESLNSSMIQVFLSCFMGVILYSLLLVQMPVRSKKSILYIGLLSCTGAILLFLRFPTLSSSYFGFLNGGLFVISFMWMFEWISRRKKCFTLHVIATIFVHVGIGLIMLGVILSSQLSNTQQLFLNPGEIQKSQSITFTLDKQSEKISMYIGTKRTKKIYMQIPQGIEKVLYPSIWNYVRNNTEYSMAMPYTVRTFFQDFQLIPLQKEEIKMELGKLTEYSGFYYGLESLDIEETSSQFTKQKMKFYLYPIGAENEKEQYYLLRIVNKQGQPLHTVSIDSSLVKDRLFWTDTKEQSIVLIPENKMYQEHYELIIQPGMLWIQMGFLLIVLGSFLLLLHFIRENFIKDKKQVK